MAKPRAKTLQERMGFIEDDLTTVGHDAIMFWLDENVADNLHEWLGIDAWTPTERHLIDELSGHWLDYSRWTKTLAEDAQAILYEQELIPQPEDPVQEAIRYMNTGMRQEEISEIHVRDIARRKAQAEERLKHTETILTNKTLPLMLPPFPGIKVTKKIWEQPITTQREYTIGFMDLVVSWSRPVLWYVSPREFVHVTRSGQWVWNQYAEWKPWHPEWEISYEKNDAAFEVKTTIQSLGELLRQLKLYEQHFMGKIFVVCPDVRFADKIREQGFGFIQSPVDL